MRGGGDRIPPIHSRIPCKSACNREIGHGDWSTADCPHRHGLPVLRHSTDACLELLSETQTLHVARAAPVCEQLLESIPAMAIGAEQHPARLLLAFVVIVAWRTFAEDR